MLTRESPRQLKQPVKEAVGAPTAHLIQRQFAALGASATPISFAQIPVLAPEERSPTTPLPHPELHLPIQRNHVTATMPSEAPPIVHEVLASPGQPLDASTRTFMESCFGHDFSRVRVHTDAKAVESAQALNARAYTVGSAVVFGCGHFAPSTSPGQLLIAHELSHTIQQSPAEIPDTGALTIVPSGHPTEREADAAAHLIIAGRSAEHLFQGSTRAPTSRTPQAPALQLQPEPTSAGSAPQSFRADWTGSLLERIPCSLSWTSKRAPSSSRPRWWGSTAMTLSSNGKRGRAR